MTKAKEFIAKDHEDRGYCVDDYDVLQMHQVERLLQEYTDQQTKELTKEVERLKGSMLINGFSKSYVNKISEIPLKIQKDVKRKIDSIDKETIKKQRKEIEINKKWFKDADAMVVKLKAEAKEKEESIEKIRNDIRDNCGWESLPYILIENILNQ